MSVNDFLGFSVLFHYPRPDRASFDHSYGSVPHLCTGACPGIFIGGGARPKGGKSRPKVGFLGKGQQAPSPPAKGHGGVL